MKYYITAYKTGIYPAVTKDRVFTWARLYPAAADAPDSVGKPANWQWVSLFSFFSSSPLLLVLLVLLVLLPLLRVDHRHSQE